MTLHISVQRMEGSAPRRPSSTIHAQMFSSRKASSVASGSRMVGKHLRPKRSSNAEEDDAYAQWHRHNLQYLNRLLLRTSPPKSELLTSMTRRQLHVNHPRPTLNFFVCMHRLKLDFVDVFGIVVIGAKLASLFVLIAKFQIYFETPKP